MYKTVKTVCALSALSLLLGITPGLPTIACAQSQNGQGGDGQGGDGQGGNYIRIRVPEPSTFVLLGVGVAGLGGLILRKRNRRRADTSTDHPTS